MSVSDFTKRLGIKLPIIGGAMYPASNAELVAAVSAAGGIGIMQPLALVFAERRDFREAIRAIRAITDRPIGMNVLTEKSSRLYLERMERWVDVALEEGVRFFVSSLGNPRWIVERARPLGGIVFHDVTERRWALKALEGGVDGLIAVNNRAGGHAGGRDPRALYDELADLGVPLVLAGGVGDERRFVEALRMGYDAVQIGTRLIATNECRAHPDYKQAIVAASAKDVVLTDKISGVPVAVLNTPYVQRTGAKAGAVARRLLRHPKAKHWMRLYYTAQSAVRLRRAMTRSDVYHDYWQAGQSVGGIHAIEPVGDIFARFGAALAAGEVSTA